MWEISSWLCIFNIKNEQSEYSELADLIRTLEEWSSGKSVCRELGGPALRIARVPADAKTAVQTIETRLADGNPKLIRAIENWETLENGMAREPSMKGFSYYIRVDTGGGSSDLANLRYLVLLMQSLPEACQKLKVFFWEDGMEAKDTYAYHDRLSRFLRFIQMEHRIFYAMRGETVRQLFEEKEVPKTFVPLLEINEETYRLIRHPYRLSAVYGDERFDQLFTAIYPQDVRNPYIIALFRIGARMFFRALDGKMYTSKEKKRKLLSLLCDAVQNAEGISALDMLLFGALMDRTSWKSFESEEAETYLYGIQSLSLGIAQILENIVRHSENKKGVFTIRIQRTQGYIQKNYPGYAISKKEYGVELLIADSNRQDDIIQNFLAGEKSTKTLRESEDNLTLADFFQKNPEGAAGRAWMEARTQNPEICLGLLTFAGTAERFHGAVSVRSCPSPEDVDGKNYYYYDYANKKRIDTAPYRRWMPGTQFAILFRCTAFRKDIRRNDQMNIDSVFYDDRIVYGTTYRELAWTLQHGSSMEPLFPAGTSAVELAEQFKNAFPDVKEQERKDAVVREWKRWFSARASHVRDSGETAGKIGKTADAADKNIRYELFDTDLAELCRRPEEWEMFCKGFLASDFFSSSFFSEWEREKKEVLYYGILLRNMSAPLGEMFCQTLFNMAERIYTGASYVYFYQEKETGGAARYIGATLHEVLSGMGMPHREPLHEFPRVLPYSLLVKEGGESLFEKEISRQAQISILSPDRQGYQVRNTHMRLGNKVHIESFFEMALFFENPNYAYYTAFLLLKQLKSLGLEEKNRILFYGYTSYSRGIVWAAIQIWQEYMMASQGIKPEMEFVIYQNDLKLESDNSSVQMYYSNTKWLQDPKLIWPAEKTALVQIVPISSSLTTFNKMLSKLNSETGRQESGAPFAPIANLTAFWVRDDFRRKWREAKGAGDPDETRPTEEEEHFWREIIPSKRMVIRDRVHDSSETPVHYLVCVSSYWHNPLNCKKCFPKNLMLEYPLVETDPTSTVPTQQFYAEVPMGGARPNEDVKDGGDTSTENFSNDDRVSRLRGNMLYGHISRGHNHFQYYTQTRRYFQQERENIIRWLSDIPRKREEGAQNIDVLVVPKQTSNVEFSQFVYEYYFRGEAESIIVNTEKEFRSNFLAEYNGLLQWLGRESKGGKKVRFHYVDMTIDSGTTFNRAGALIRSLFCGENGRDAEGDFRTAFPFESVFLLISRMSEESKRTYVKVPDRQFHVYVQLDISNMRTYGDSCVPCKLQREAYLHYQNAATKLVSEYWEKKSILRKDIYFDQCDQDCRTKTGCRTADRDEGYRRMACTHRATGYIRRARGKEISDYFAALRGFFSELLLAVKAQETKTVSPVFKGAEEERLGWLSAGLKIVIRPFFSYDFKLRCAAMDLFLLLVGRLLDPDNPPNAAELSRVGKTHLNQENLDWAWSFSDELSEILKEDLGRISRDKLNILLGDEPDEMAGRKPFAPNQQEDERNIPFLWLRFIQSHLFKGLVDLRSNYILRRETILLVCRQLANVEANKGQQDVFFNHYLRSILRLMHTSSDETKSVWLENLLQLQLEYDLEDGEKPGESMTQRIKRDWPKVHSAFCRFFDLLLVENNRPLFQGVRDLAQVSVGGSTVTTKDVLQEYYMRNVCQFINLGAGNGMSTESECAERELLSLQNLYKLLNAGDKTPINSKDPLAWYHDLRKELENIISERRQKQPDEQVLLFGQHVRGRDLPPYYMISPSLAVDYTGQAESDVVLKRLAERLDASEGTETLEENGYLLLPRLQSQKETDSNCRESLYDAILVLDNNFEAISQMDCQGYAIQKIEPIYIFLPCGASRKETLMMVRRILMFRCALVACLERDFNNNAIANLIRQRYWAETLAADKVGDHNELGFIECMQQLVTDEGAWNETNTDIMLLDGTVKRGAFRRKSYDWGRGNIDEEWVDNSELSPLVRTRRWYFLCSYINSRISRLYRTYARETNHRECTGDQEDSIEQLKSLYSRENQDIGMEPACNLRDMFFAQIEAGYSRKDYIVQAMQVITFHIKEKKGGEIVERMDTEKGEAIEDRLSFMQEVLRDYDCIQFDVGTDKYSYLSEYLAVIFMDCCISALKAGEDWNATRWGDLAFTRLCQKQPAEKCRIVISRQRGIKTEDSSRAFDYLVIENDVYEEHGKEIRQGPGMSQKAIGWYIDKLWQSVKAGKEDAPKAEFIKPSHSGEMYCIKLPILKRKEGEL